MLSADEKEDIISTVMMRIGLIVFAVWLCWWLASNGWLIATLVLGLLVTVAIIVMIALFLVVNWFNEQRNRFRAWRRARYVERRALRPVVPRIRDPLGRFQRVPRRKWFVL